MKKLKVTEKKKSKKPKIDITGREDNPSAVISLAANAMYREQWPKALVDRYKRMLATIAVRALVTELSYEFEVEHEPLAIIDAEATD